MADAQALILEVLKKGEPTRVIVEPTNTRAVPPDAAKNCHGIVPTIVFIRHDGWSLGAPKHLEEYAESAGKVDGWVAVIRDFQFALKEFRSYGISIFDE